MRKRFTHPSKSSEDNNYFQLKRGLFHTINQQFTHSLWTYTSTSYSLTLLNYHFVGMSSDTLSGKHVLRKSELPPPGGGSFLHHSPTIVPPPNQPQGGKGRYWANLKDRHSRSVAPTLPFSREPNKRSGRGQA